MQQASRGADQKRGYRLGRRADKAAGTRRRITRAAYELHATVGPANTSVAAIAARAGVQRRTVYAHFPDLDELYLACTLYGMEITGMPDPSEWGVEPDPLRRVSLGLGALYAWYAANERMLANVLAGEPPIGAPRVQVDPFTARLRHAVDVLGDVAGGVAGVGDPSGIRTRVVALVTHAVAFETWRSLTAAGLTTDGAVAVMADAIAREAGRDIAPPTLADR